jgi:type III pantothenate kinase
VLLAIDVGNTQTVVGMFGPGPTDMEPSSDAAKLLHHWRIATVSERTADEYALLVTHLLDLEDLDIADTVSGVALSSGVPRVTAALRETFNRWYPVPVVVVEPGTRTGMPIVIDNPKEVGADRIANAVAAFDLYGGPTVVVDLGTATTFDAISAKGEYLGGAIAPGVEISLDALVERTAALRRVELVEAPRHLIGKSTVEALQSGAVYGCAAMVDGMCRRLEEELGPSTVVATGGLSELIGRASRAVQHHEPWLTLYGLRLVFERNVVPR